MKTYLALIRIDIRLAFRQRVVIFFNYVMPLAFFFLFAQAFHAEQGGGILQVVTMVTTIGILGNGLFGAGIRAVQERESNILRRYKVAPISPLPLMVASTVTGLVVYMPYVLLMLFLAKTRYGMVVPANIGQVILFIVLGVIAIRSIGLIIASVVNSMAESNIIVQIVYMSMLFLSGASFPTSMFPNWLLTVTQFIPATYLMTGMQGLLLRGESLAQNWQAVAALLLTGSIGLFLCIKLFRWEKEEKMRPAAKFWVLAVLLPFLILGSYQAWAKDNVTKMKVLSRELYRSQTLLIRNARIFVGTGKVIENGAVLIKNGRIAQVFEGAGPEPKDVSASPIDAAGKTVLPGLIDMHVHLGAPGGFVDDWKNYNALKASERALAAYLYSGITAVRSAGDSLDSALKARAVVNSGEKLGAEMFMAGPLFTVPGGHGTEYFKGMPAQIRRQAEAQFVRTPKNAEEAAEAVNALKKDNVDCIKAIMEAGAGGAVYNRMDVSLLNAIGAAAHEAKLPLVVHTGDVRDIQEALQANANSIEHGSFRERIPDDVFLRMARQGATYDPTLSVGEAFPEFAAGKLDLLNRSLVQQVVPASILASTRKRIASPESQSLRKEIGDYPVDMNVAKDNLARAWKAGVKLIAGSDAGNMLVFHGPTIQHELKLWVEAGIPIADALRAATLNSARALGTDARMGSVEAGKEATLLVVDGNPLEDVKALEAISFVVLKGERVNRGDLFGED